MIIKKELTIKKEKGFTLIEEIKDLLKQQGVLFLEIGKRLKIIREEQLYLELGYDTWMEFAVSGQLPYRKSTIYAYIDIYEIFIERYEFEYNELIDIPWDKLALILPKARKIEKKKEIVELIGKARELSRTDLMIELGEIVENGVAKTILVKLFLDEKCGKYRLDFNKDDLCICDNFPVKLNGLSKTEVITG